jgi:3-oxoacyl-[acyl-carrier protein] reductase
VNPGPVATDMWFSTSEKFRASIGLEKYLPPLSSPLSPLTWKSNSTPAEGRVGEPDDIAQVVAFLCEEGSRWVTGSTVCANGGMLPN